jgi:hypothetical protein
MYNKLLYIRAPFGGETAFLPGEPVELHTTTLSKVHT